MLTCAGYTVQWVENPTPKKVMQLVDKASHYIAHPVSLEGALFAMQVCVVCVCLIVSSCGRLCEEWEKERYRERESER